MVVLQSLRSRRIMESARTMSSSSSRYVENMAHVQAGEVHVNCPSIMTVSSGKGHTTTLTPTMCPFVIGVWNRNNGCSCKASVFA